MAADGVAAGNDPVTNMKDNSAGVAVKLLEFLFVFFSLSLDDKLSEFLTSDANANKAPLSCSRSRRPHPDIFTVSRCCRP